VSSVKSVVAAINELKGDPTITRHIRERLECIIAFLEQDPQLGKDKAMLEIEELFSANSIEPHLRSQMWNVVSQLETI